jgi:hypothetical protein
MHRLARAACAATLLALATPGLLRAQQPQQRPDCTAAEHRQFDFWVGTWDVTAPNGTKAGENRISLILDRCVLFEEWTGAGGSTGKSFNVYDRSRQVWHQTWVDNAGSLLQLEGRLVDGAMVLEGSTAAASGSKVMHRVTWSKVGSEPDRVRQHWQQSTDGGSTWTTAFDGLYTKRSG